MLSDNVHPASYNIEVIETREGLIYIHNWDSMKGYEKFIIFYNYYCTTLANNFFKKIN